MTQNQAQKRSSSTDITGLQEGNRSWWTGNTMSYDWNDRIATERFTIPWFDEADARFVRASRLYATDTTPFDRLIPFSTLGGKDVLEIGCGMGFHSELMSKAGANLEAIDFSETSVNATRERFRLKGLAGKIEQADAESLPFPDASFDFVWSWGVIHHSSRTARIAREIHRVLRPGGECRIMVYNRAGAIVPIVFLRDHVLRGKFLKQDFDLTLLTSSDGFHARFYTRDQFSDLFRAFFREVSIETMGQESDALPLPGFLRKLVLPFVTERWLKRRQSSAGTFLFLTATHPI